MTLHIFNPEHDIALASGLTNFTAPHAGKQLRHDLGWLPALWAADGDTVLVDDVAFATKKLRLRRKLLAGKNIRLQSPAKQTSLSIDHVEPWGWDPALKARLIRMGMDNGLLPSDQQLAGIRSLSHRRTAAGLLTSIRTQLDGVYRLTGESTECTTLEDISKHLALLGRVVLKAPWSSSGRGVKFTEAQLSPSQEGWIKNVLKQQGSVMVEPYYKKVKDFGMEFSSNGKGGISYEGLSLFHTANGAYTGNLLATETYKERELERYLPMAMLRKVRHSICQLLTNTMGTTYEGPFGVDMMIVRRTENDNQLWLHPCVELNLRRTMGHAALSLTRLVNPGADDDIVRVMRIVCEDHQYKLRIERP